MYQQQHLIAKTVQNNKHVIISTVSETNNIYC